MHLGCLGSESRMSKEIGTYFLKQSQSDAASVTDWSLGWDVRDGGREDGCKVRKEIGGNRVSGLPHLDH